MCVLVLETGNPNPESKFLHMIFLPLQIQPPPAPPSDGDDDAGSGGDEDDDKAGTAAQLNQSQENLPVAPTVAVRRAGTEKK
jgi:hypothetical protein